MVSFYRRLIKGFSTLIATITKCTKKGSFERARVAHNAFEKLKSKRYKAPVLALPNFDKLFKVDCDVSGVDTGAIHM